MDRFMFYKDPAGSLWIQVFMESLYKGYATQTNNLLNRCCVAHGFGSWPLAVLFIILFIGQDSKFAVDTSYLTNCI